MVAKKRNSTHKRASHKRKSPARHHSASTSYQPVVTVSSASLSRSSSSHDGFLGKMIGLVILIGLGVGIWYLFTRGGKTTSVPSLTTTGAPDTPKPHVKADPGSFLNLESKQNKILFGSFVAITGFILFIGVFLWIYSRFRTDPGERELNRTNEKAAKTFLSKANEAKKQLDKVHKKNTFEKFERSDGEGKTKLLGFVNEGRETFRTLISTAKNEYADAVKMTKNEKDKFLKFKGKSLLAEVTIENALKELKDRSKTTKVLDFLSMERNPIQEFLERRAPKKSTVDPTEQEK